MGLKDTRNKQEASVGIAFGIYVQEYIRRLNATEFNDQAGMQHALRAIQDNPLADASEKGVLTILVCPLYTRTYKDCTCIIHLYATQPADYNGFDRMRAVPKLKLSITCLCCLQNAPGGCPSAFQMPSSTCCRFYQGHIRTFQMPVCCCCTLACNDDIVLGSQNKCWGYVHLLSLLLVSCNHGCLAVWACSRFSLIWT